MVRCSGVGCSNSATKLKCPTCIKKALPDAFFCSQECFKKNWPIHSLLHVVEAKPAMEMPEVFRGYQFTGPLRPGKVSPFRSIKPGMDVPDYAVNGIPVSERVSKNASTIHVHTPEEIAAARLACRLSREVLEIGAALVKPGVTGEEIDIAVHNACMERNAYPSPLNYNYFPKSCCVSVNEVICHGIPDSRPLENGDIVNIDISLYYGGFHGDVNATYLVGEVDDESKRLVQTTKECLEKAIAKCRPGTLYRDIGNIISQHANANGFSVVKSYCGHGIGRLFHTVPNVPHYAKNKAVGIMQPGHIFTIEPMINVGTWQSTLWPDDWTAVTRDGKRSAQFEETLLITEDGVEILTGKFD